MGLLSTPVKRQLARHWPRQHAATGTGVFARRGDCGGPAAQLGGTGLDDHCRSAPSCRASLALALRAAAHGHALAHGRGSAPSGRQSRCRTRRWLRLADPFRPLSLACSPSTPGTHATMFMRCTTWNATTACPRGNLPGEPDAARPQIPKGPTYQDPTNEAPSHEFRRLPLALPLLLSSTAAAAAPSTPGIFACSWNRRA
jgi:hypothetical protein